MSMLGKGLYDFIRRYESGGKKSLLHDEYVDRNDNMLAGNVPP